MNKNKRFAIKDTITDRYSDLCGITKKEAKDRFEDILGVAVDCLCDDDYDGIIFRNILTLEKVKKTGRNGRVPINGVAYSTPSTLKLKVSIGKILREKMNK